MPVEALVKVFPLPPILSRSLRTLPTTAEPSELLQARCPESAARRRGRGAGPAAGTECRTKGKPGVGACKAYKRGTLRAPPRFRGKLGEVPGTRRPRRRECGVAMAVLGLARWRGSPRMTARLPSRSGASMPLSLFHPAVAAWFVSRFGTPTEPQERAWPSIVAGRNTLIAAPTGSGKTLAAFLAAIDQLVRASLAGELGDETRVVYVSPLKALSNDVHRNLEEPLAEIRRELAARGLPDAPIRPPVGTGATPGSARAA